MIDNYRILFFRYLYEKLNLKEIEDYLEKNNINYIDNDNLMCNEEKICFHYSKYFYLLNDINFELLNSEGIAYLKSINKDSFLDSNIINFLESTYKRVLFNNFGKYYGPHSDQYYVNGDYIVLGIKFDELGFASRNIKTRKEIENNNNIVDSIISKIENNLNYKIKIIKYNELFEKHNG